jgi:hypothetical protein
VQALTIQSADAATCTRGKTQTKWTSVKKPFKLVGYESLDLAAGVGYDDTLELTHVTDITVSVKSSTTISAKLKVKMLGSLEATSKLDLAAMGKSTTGIKKTLKYTIASTRSDREFVFFKGVRQVTGNWQYRTCKQYRTGGPDDVVVKWSPWTKGSARSYAGSGKGVINCASTQKAGSMAALAKKLGC